MYVCYKGINTEIRDLLRNYTGREDFTRKGKQNILLESHRKDWSGRIKWEGDEGWEKGIK